MSDCAQISNRAQSILDLSVSHVCLTNSNAYEKSKIAYRIALE